MNQSFKTNQLLRIVDDAKSPDVEPQVQVVADGSKTAMTDAKRTVNKDLLHVAETGLVQKTTARARARA